MSLPHWLLYIKLICWISTSLNPVILLYVSMMCCLFPSFVVIVFVPRFANAVELNKYIDFFQFKKLQQEFFENTYVYGVRCTWCTWCVGGGIWNYYEYVLIYDTEFNLYGSPNITQTCSASLNGNHMEFPKNQQCFECEMRNPNLK